jgi:hypothetical protein
MDETTPNILLEDLRRQIQNRHVVAIVGAGVSVAAADNKSVASWKGLLTSGVERCVAVVPALPDGWASRVQEEINSGDLDDLLSAAEKVSSKLSNHGGEYARWLRETVGSLRVVNSDVIIALNNLGVPLVTTNYDGLIEDVTRTRSVTWLQAGHIEAILRGDDRGVIHLHGHWRDPKSVVLGIRSYDSILGHAPTQALLRALRAMRTLLFVGFGAGLSDPNFGALLRWARTVFAESEYRHFRLCTRDEHKKVQAQHDETDRIYALVYGETHGDLPAFLHGLVPEQRPARQEEIVTVPPILEGQPAAASTAKEGIAHAAIVQASPFEPSRLRHRILDIQSMVDHVVSATGSSASIEGKGFADARASVLRKLGDLYVDLYLFWCRQSGAPEELAVGDTARDVSAHRSGKDTLPHRSSEETLVGVRTVHISISQMFRMADLLICPESVRAQRFHEVITNPAKLRRALNRRSQFPLGRLGSVKPVAMITDQFNSFWRVGVPDLRRPSRERVCFLPFELDLTSQLAELSCAPGSILDDVIGQVDCLVENRQISGRLRIYPPGVGVVRLGLTFRFRSAVHVKTIVQIAQDIEDVLFVDPAGVEKPCQQVLLEIIDEVSDCLFLDQKLAHEERRWLPPETVFSLRDDAGFKLEDNLEALSRLLASAPGNGQAQKSLGASLRRALRSPHWQRDQIFAAAGQRVSLFFVGSSFASGKKQKQGRLLEWLIETGELVSAAAYAEKCFVEELEKLADLRLLDESWMPGRGAQFAYLLRLVQTMKIVLQAIAETRSHLQNHGAGVLMSFAKDIWAYNNPVRHSAVEDALAYVAGWASQACQRGESAEMDELIRCSAEINALSSPFKTKKIDRSDSRSNIGAESVSAEVWSCLEGVYRLAGSENPQDFTRCLGELTGAEDLLAQLEN